MYPKGGHNMHKFLKITSYFLVLLGALNWGLVGLFDFNLVEFMLGDMTLLARFVYGLIGISAAVAAVTGHMYEKRYCIEE